MIQTFSSFSSLFLKRWCCFVSHMEIFYLYLKKNWAYSTEYSQAVTHPSTNSAQCCLTSVIGRELVFSTWYGRRHFGLKRYHTLSDWSTLSPHVNKNLFLYHCLIHVKQWTLICPQPFTFPMVFGPRQISGEKDWPTAQSIPRRSPIQVLTPPNVA